jgi:hypothetical protein
MLRCTMNVVWRIRLNDFFMDFLMAPEING